MEISVAMILGGAMKYTALRVAVSLGLLGLGSACATNTGGYKSESAIRERLKQMDKSEVALKLGAPTQQAVVAEGQEVWTYESTLVSVIGGQCKISVSFDGNRVKDAVVTSFDYSPVAAPMGSCSQIVRALD